MGAFRCIMGRGYDFSTEFCSVGDGAVVLVNSFVNTFTVTRSKRRVECHEPW